MAKKFIRGTFELEKDVTDLVTFEAKIESELTEIVSWAKANNVGLNIGTSEDNTYLCEFTVTARTDQMCKGYVAELKEMWKQIFPKSRILFQASGNLLR